MYVWFKVYIVHVNTTLQILSRIYYKIVWKYTDTVYMYIVYNTYSYIVDIVVYIL